MEKLYSPATNLNPEILLSPEDNAFIIKGNSRPENAGAVYEPLIQWLKEYKNTLTGNDPVYNRDNPFILQLDLEYFNSSSAKFLYDIAVLAGSFTEKNIPVAIAWTYDPSDPETREAGEDLAELAEAEFVYIKRQD
ncbi:MAG: DUF1987 domain-containing protein [Bacteroidales bacterium]|nr:DUF1987 domain-containing protein [Bacteroidales bacterium]